jgi:hypothetical protein
MINNLRLSNLDFFYKIILCSNYTALGLKFDS